MEVDDREFSRVAAGRPQADAWRNGLIVLTAVLGAAFIVRGRDDVVHLAWWLQWWIAFLLVVAFASLIRAVFLAYAAASGEGDRLRRDIDAAKRWTIAGLSMIAMALLVVWLSPVAETARPLMKVEYDAGTTCGPVSFAHDGYLVVATRYVVGPGDVVDTKVWIPVDKVSRLTEVPACP
ncbi:hypothetical protein AB0M47_35045 [Hamadaea sp. NPDC051192]|uniref:hypothetical protein n=1 Tax=Hamadaea sp. NPDC051192 TaxID=3154940 RepID=UPI003414DEF8